MNADIDTQFVTRINYLEDHLLDPIIDHSSLPEFDHQWASFVDDLQEALDADFLSASTISLSHALVDRISAVMQTFSDLEIVSASIVAPPSTADPVVTLSPPSPSTNIAPYPYIKSAYVWFLNNIHNPYPSTSIRDQIAKETQSARKDIDSWFIDVRKRIGWNTLRKSHFYNKRADIVDAAKRFFVENDPENPLEPLVGCEFAAIEMRLKDLYLGKFFESDLLIKFNEMVEDKSSEAKASGKVEGGRLGKKKVSVRRGVSSYPSPECSPIHSPLSPPSVSEDDTEEIVAQSISQSSRKRRTPSGYLDSSFLSKPAKQPRIETSPENHTQEVTGLLSPALSILDSFDDNSTPQLVTPIDAIACGRKRRLSDIDDSQDTPERPRKLSVPFKSPIVLDPIPPFDTSQLDSWFDTHFAPNIPGIDTGASTPLDIELYDFSTFHKDSQIMDTVQYPSPEIQGYDGQLSASDLLIPQSFDLDASFNSINSYGLFSLDNYSQNVGRQDLAVEGSSFSYELPTSAGTHFSSNFLGEFELHPSQRANQILTVDISSPNVTATFDPLSPSSTFPFSPESPPMKQRDKLTGPTDISSQTSELSNAMHTNTKLMNGINCSVTLSEKQTSALKDRAAKQQELFEARETARRLEAELAASSTFK